MFDLLKAAMASPSQPNDDDERTTDGGRKGDETPHSEHKTHTRTHGHG
jgi:hypothetical protein